MMELRGSAVGTFSAHWLSGMTVRITTAELHGKTVVRVDGWLESPDEAEELLRVAMSAPKPVVLDLRELHDADANGVTALHSLAKAGCRLTRVSDFIKLLLETGEGRMPTMPSTSTGGAQ